MTRPGRGARGVLGLPPRGEPGARTGAPLAVLFGLNLVDEFDRVGFATLAPEIRDALGVSDATIVAVATASAAVAILAAIPVGYLADRGDRVHLSIVGALLWGAAAIATGLTDLLLVIAAARFAAGTGRLVNDTAHPSLLADYYPRQSLPAVSAVHRLGTSVGAIVAAPVAGLLATAVGWRAAFLVLAAPTLLLVLAATRLRDPALSAAARRQARQPLGLVASWRALRRKRTLRRMWVAGFFFGAAFVPIVTVLLSVLFDRVYGLGPASRGGVLSLFGTGSVAGLALGAGAAHRALRRAQPAAVMRAIAWSFTAFGASLVVLGSVNTLAIAVFTAVAVAVAGYSYIPPYLTLVVLITRPAFRAQAYAYALFFFGLGGLFASRVVAAALLQGVRPTVVVLGALALCAAAVAHTIPALVPNDVEGPADPGG